MTERADPQADPTPAPAARRHLTRTLLALTAFTFLAWLAWFIWLVAVELETERAVQRSLSQNIVLTFGGGLALGPSPKPWMTYEDAIAEMREASGVEITIEPSVLRDIGHGLKDKIAHWRTTAAPQGFEVRDRTPGLLIRGDLATMLDDFTFALGDGIGWRIKGDHVVIFAADNTSRFDASAKARQYWHILNNWWNNP